MSDGTKKMDWKRDCYDAGSDVGVVSDYCGSEN